MKIPFLKPPYGDEEIAAVTRVMRTADLTIGPDVEAFENKFAEYIGTNHAVAVNSGTSALELTLQALILSGRLDMGAGVIIPSFTFVAVANAVVMSGLTPVFVDIDLNTNNIDPEKIDLHQGVLNSVQAIIPVHTFGMPCNLGAIGKFARDHDLIVIEDCCEAVGAEYDGCKVGSRSDCAVFSFTPTKNMTTGEGGMITTNSKDLERVLRSIRNHGMTDHIRDSVIPGHNYRMSNIAAAIGLVQLEKLDELNDARERNALSLNRLIEEKHQSVRVPVSMQGRTYQIYSIVLSGGAHGPCITGDVRDEVIRALHERGVDAKAYFSIPIHSQTFFESISIIKSESGLLMTDIKAGRVIALPMYPDLSDEELRYMADSLADAIKEVLR